MVFKNPEIATGYCNTIFRTVVGTVLSLLATCLTAFPLSRKSLPFRSPLTFFILFTMIFSGGILPSFLLIRSLHLYDNIWVYIIPGLLSAFNIIIMKNFFQSIPDSLYESAMLDGASDWTILTKIYIPLSKPVLATVLLWTAVGHWNAWFDALLYISSNSKQVMQIFLQRIVVQNDYAMIAKGHHQSESGAIYPGNDQGRHRHYHRAAYSAALSLYPTLFHQGDHDRQCERIDVTAETP